MKIDFINYNNSLPLQNRTNLKSASACSFCGEVSFKNDTEKLYSIYSKEELNKLYGDISRTLKLDYIPKFEIVDDYKDGRGGGYNFYRNEVSLCASDLVCSDYKIVGTKNGKRTVLFDPKTLSPLFATKEMAEEFLVAAKTRNNHGFDLLEAVPTSADDKKRLIVQKLSHELIHAQQHMLMRYTEGIDEKKILAAWTHFSPKNDEDKIKFLKQVDEIYKNSFWADKPKTAVKIQRNSTVGYITYGWLNAVKNYPPVQSPEYNRNAIEVDAYRRSADYAQHMFGLLKP